MKKTKLFIALASMLALTSAANAYTVEDFGLLTPTDMSTTMKFAPGSFTEYITFSIGDSYPMASGSVMNTPMGTSFAVSNLVASLYSGHLCTTCADELSGASFMGSVVVGSSYESRSGLLKAGDYFVRLAGNATGSLGGKLTFTAYAAPVPEPETYAMFMAGLGLMGAIARRRRS